jgi:hypothetical protein
MFRTFDFDDILTSTKTRRVNSQTASNRAIFVFIQKGLTSQIVEISNKCLCVNAINFFLMHWRDKCFKVLANVLLLAQGHSYEIFALPVIKTTTVLSLFELPV